MNSVSPHTSFDADGWVTTPPVLAEPTLDALHCVLTPLLAASPEKGGVRELLDIPAVQILARSAPVRRVAEEAIGSNCFAVRGILFDKTPNANWKVTWHQDLTIAVRERRDSTGFVSWTEKDGVPHVQPPHTVLERMVAVRVHLDPCGIDNGPVRVLSGSHRYGRLTGQEIDAWKARVPPIDCLVERGGILAFFPLLLHASSPAQSPMHRRVVHLEFAAEELKELAGGLSWHQIV